MGIDEINLLYERWAQFPPLEEIGLESILMAGMHLTKESVPSDKPRQIANPSQQSDERNWTVPVDGQNHWMLGNELGNKAQHLGPIPPPARANFVLCLKTIEEGVRQSQKHAGR